MWDVVTIQKKEGTLMIFSKSVKLSVLALCLAGVTSNSMFAACTKTATKCCPTTKCITSCEGTVSGEKLLMDAGSLSLSILTYYLYHKHLRSHWIDRADSSTDESRHAIVEELGKVIAGAWFIENAKEFAKNARCYVMSKVAPAVEQAHAAVAGEAEVEAA